MYGENNIAIGLVTIQTYTGVHVESRMSIGQQPPFNNQCVGKVAFWLAQGKKTK